jgi:hypothetical protein
LGCDQRDAQGEENGAKPAHHCQGRP